MRLDIAFRLRPYVRRPGVPMLLPGTDIIVTPYPKKIKLSNLQGIDLGELDPEVAGSVESFQIMQDLEKGCIVGWGRASSGFFRWHLFSTADRKEVLLRRHSTKVPFNRQHLSATERLCLGFHKQLDWDLVTRRKDLREYLPVVWRLAQLTPGCANCETDTLLAAVQEAVRQRSRSELEPLLHALFQAGFYGLLVPSGHDRLYQGFTSAPVSNPSALLPALARCLREMVVQVYGGGRIEILPAIPPLFVCGRLTGFVCEGGIIDLEWTKRFIRRMVFRCRQSQEFHFSFPNGISRFRLRRHSTDRGEWLDCSKTLAVYEGQVLWLDCFTA